jgi:hypothetical protein
MIELKEGTIQAKRDALVRGLAAKVGGTCMPIMDVAQAKEPEPNLHFEPGIVGNQYFCCMFAPYRVPPAIKNLTYPDFERVVVQGHLDDGFKLDSRSFAGRYLLTKGDQYVAYMVRISWDDGRNESQLLIRSCSGSSAELGKTQPAP